MPCFDKLVFGNFSADDKCSSRVVARLGVLSPQRLFIAERLEAARAQFFRFTPLDALLAFPGHLQPPPTQYRYSHTRMLPFVFASVPSNHFRGSDITKPKLFEQYFAESICQRFAASVAVKLYTA